MTRIDETQTDRPEDFFRELPRTFAYPLRGRGKSLIIGGAVFLWVAGLLSWVPFAGFAIVLIVAGYLCAYTLKVIGSSAGGDREPPDWPDMSRMWEDVIQPLLLVVSAAAVSFLPLLIHQIVFGFSIHWNEPGFWACVGFAIMYMPMAMTGVSLFDSFWGLNPLIVFGAILKIPVAYLTACSILLVNFIGYAIVLKYVVPAVPVFGSFIGYVIYLYILLLQAHICGLIYCCHERRIAWFPEQ